LERLADGGWQVAYPGHGSVIADPLGRIAELLAHRRKREAALLAALAGGPMPISALTAAVYADVPVAMHPAARRNVLAHVIDLYDKGRVACDDLCAPDPSVQAI
jgi:glyoxylase-like metal-dependent hydrolase (beta-lactamase superfamily II)